MKLLIQRVEKAAVYIEGKVYSSIDKGLVVLLGIHKTDEENLIDQLIQKLLHLRIFEDTDKKMNLSLQDLDYQLLVVSQFTLYADCISSGKRPGFSEAMPPEKASAFYDLFVSSCQQRIKDRLATGIFGAQMQLSLVNDGPASFILEKFSPKKN